ncbi:3-hydroxyisobutyrate dehydrogenase [Nocardioides sp. BE266]|uniref:NAD(P)-dependent oxidoreductase n=1 Tax=Nocardioides sp. BE266 TaxID=2817725 RepID=UPI0028614278|nr:NAD(P)-dependent oxidoreductase [Nocardioides sp. BE266]MDR7251120.1 3-hydroxyisobutyrate dehydrogenase [Nocardioides sp. BE266]
MDDVDPVGFIGLGHMGEPIAVNLLRAGRRLVAWTRRAERVQELVRAGATGAVDVGQVLDSCEVVLVMLADAAALDEVLGWDGSGFAHPLAGRTLVNLGTVSTASASAFHERVREAGGRYVEAPVSGSRVPAQRGELVVMLAGDGDLDPLEQLLAPISRAVVRCGAVPAATATKLSVNAFLVSLVTALAESVHLAERSGVDLDVLHRVLDSGPMASAVSRMRLAAMLERDYAPQTAIDDVVRNCQLVLELAESAGTGAPMARRSHDLYTRSSALGFGAADMAAVVEALRA